MSILSDDSKAELREFELTIKMVKLAGERTERFFTFFIPAVDAEKARHAGYQIGIGINEGSGHQWKFPREDKDFCEVREVVSEQAE